MKQCGRCGAQNLDQCELCTSCGLELPAAATGFGGTMVMSPPELPQPEPTPPEPAAATGFGGTMVMSPPELPQPEAPKLEPAVATGFGGTMVMSPPELPKPDPAPRQPTKGNLRGTMIGMAPPAFTSPDAEALGGPVPAPSGGQPPLGSGVKPPARQFAGTMIGMAPATFPSPPPPPGPEALPPVVPATGTPRSGSAQKTMLGVARPGIAPLNPGQAKPPVSSASAPAPVSWQPAPPTSAQGEAPLSPPRSPAPPRISLTATLAIVGSAMLLVMAVVAFFMVRGHGNVTARASLDAHGAEQLELSCHECPDGTKTWIDSAPVTFQSGKALLRLQSTLKVGENPLVLVLERPGRSREEIALSLPIEFRVRSSTEELSQDSPKVSVLASVLAGTKLEVDGKPVSPDPNGVVRFDYEVTNDVTGPEASVTTLERIVPYEATSARGVKQRGQVHIRVGVTPLIVDAPGPSIVVGDKDVVIAGRTAPGAVLSVGAQVISLDPEGRFVSKQALTAGDNSFTVRSTLKELAPRLVKVSVRRSDNLEREAALARANTQTSYVEALRTGDAAIGRSLAVEGPLFDVRHDGYTSVLLVDVKGGCKKAPCLAKVIYGTASPLEKGRAIKAFGKVVRFVDGARSGERIPEMRADLVVAGAP